MENKDLKIDLEIQTIEMPEPKLLINGEDIPTNYETSNQLHALECIKHAIDTIDSAVSQMPHIAWQLIHKTAIALATEYPTHAHFAIAREAMRDEEIKGIDRQSKEYKNLVIQVATLTNEHFQKLKISLSIPKSLKEIFNEVEASANTLMETTAALTITNWTDTVPCIDSYFEKSGLFRIDDLFIKYLKKIGPNGKLMAENLKSPFIKHYESFKESGKYPLSFWFNLPSTPSQPIFLSYAWTCLAKAIWHDEVSRRLHLITEGLPNIIENDQRHIMGLLSYNKKIEQTKTQIQVFTHGQLLGEVPIPMIPEGAINTVLNGLNKMKLVEGHRALRYMLRTTFNQYIDGNPDHRVIRRESFPDMAKELGLKSRKSIANMVEVFQAMAYFDFKRPNCSGNLIALKRFKSAKTHRLDGVEITVGTMLLPYRACEDFKSGESRLMIPILSDPLLVGSNQYHAGQYSLQMLVMREFAHQSVDFAKYGHIKISQELWSTMAQECAVLPILFKIIDKWTQDGSDGPKFLDKVGNDFYTLGSAYQKERDFIIDQGDYRVKQSERGKVSASKRIKTKK